MRRSTIAATALLLSGAAFAQVQRPAGDGKAATETNMTTANSSANASTPSDAATTVMPGNSQTPTDQKTEPATPRR